MRRHVCYTDKKRHMLQQFRYERLTRIIPKPRSLYEIDQTIDLVLLGRQAASAIPLLGKRKDDLPAARLQIENQIRIFRAAEKILPNRFTQLANWMKNSQEHAQFIREMLQVEGATGLLQDLETNCSAAREKHETALSEWRGRATALDLEKNPGHLPELIRELFASNPDDEVMGQICVYATKRCVRGVSNLHLTRDEHKKIRESLAAVIDELDKKKLIEYSRKVEKERSSVSTILSD